MINDYLWGKVALRVLGGVDFRRELISGGVLILSFSCSFELLY
jgi:hypothetical protein